MVTNPINRAVSIIDIFVAIAIWRAHGLYAIGPAASLGPPGFVDDINVFPHKTIWVFTITQSCDL